MSAFRSPSPSSQSPHRKSWMTCQAQLIAATLFAGLQTLPMAAGLAAGSTPGTIIRNQATGSFVDTKDGSLENIESNTVQVTVAEVAGITVTPAGLIEAPTGVSGAGPTQGNGSFDSEDIVYFVYEITNVGNDPTQFFIPGTASSVTNGAQLGQIEIIEIDTDGSGPTPSTDLQRSPVPIQNAGNNTGDAIAPGQPLVLGLPQGSLPPDGTLKVRIPVKFNAGLNPGDQVTVVLGDANGNDNSANTQNQAYSANGSNGDLYTQDNQDGDGIANETPGNPANGDSTNHRQEASARLSATVGDANLERYTVSGVLFLDNDGDDVPNPSGADPGLDNITVYLYEDLNNDGILDANDDKNGDGILDANDIVASDITDSDGAYSFQALNGNYLIQPDASDPDILAYRYGGVTNTANDPLNNPRNVDVSGADVTAGLDFPHDLAPDLTDYGDAPDTGTGSAAENYQTLDSDSGPSHGIDTSIYLGAGVTPDSDGFVEGTDDNGDASDDTDDGVLLAGNTFQGQTLVPGTTSTLDINTVGNGVLNAWIDWNQNGDFSDPGEQIATDLAPTGNAISLNVTVPNTANLGTTYARFRFSTDTGLTSTGLANDGEVEDYQLTLETIAANPDLDSNFCQLSTDMMFILDNSGSVSQSERQDQRDAVMAMLNYLVDNNITSRVGIVRFDSSAATVISYTNVTAANLPTFENALNSNYVNIRGGATNWEAGFQQAISLGVSPGSPDVVFFFTDGTINSGGSPEDEALQLKQTGAHIYGIGIQALTINNFLGVTDGSNTAQFDAALGNASTADYVEVENYNSLADDMTSLFRSLCPPTTSNPNVLLVKRITAINGSTNNNGIDLTAYDPDPGFPYDDNVLEPAANPADTDKWPVTVGETSSTFLLGARDAGLTKPDDEVDYTIYFLSTGDTDAYDVQLCDRVPDLQTFVPDAFNLETLAPNGGIGANRGILIEFNGNRVAHTNDADGDLAQYYPPGSTLPAACNGIPSQTEDNGAIVVNLGNLPKATSAGNPLNSFGFIRFRTKVK